MFSWLMHWYPPQSFPCEAFPSSWVDFSWQSSQGCTFSYHNFSSINLPIIFFKSQLNNGLFSPNRLCLKGSLCILQRYLPCASWVRCSGHVQPGGSSWKTQGLLERLNLSAGFGEVLCLPGLAGGGGWGEKDLGISKRLLHRPGKAAENEWMDLIWFIINLPVVFTLIHALQHSSGWLCMLVLCCSF